MPADEKSLRIAAAAMKAQKRIEEMGGPPDIGPVPGMEMSGGGGSVSGSQYVAEAMGVSQTQANVAMGRPSAPSRPAVTVTTPTVRSVATPATVPEGASAGIRIGGAYGNGHTARMIKRVLSEERRIAEGSGRPMHSHPVTPIHEGVRPALDVDGAMNELRSRDRAQIEYDTALTWTARAIASYTLSIQSPDRAAQGIRYGEGCEYEAEAKEHASQVPDNGKLLKYVVEQIEQSKQSALANMARPDFQR